MDEEVKENLGKLCGETAEWLNCTRRSQKLTAGRAHADSAWPGLPDQLLVVEGLDRLSSQDVDLALEDRQLDFALHVLL